MKKQQLMSLLDRHIDAYLNNIAVELEKTHHQFFDNFGFPIFGETSKDYHEQVYFQSYLESYTRQLINGALKEIADGEAADKIEWPEFEFFGIYSGYTNAECESKFGFEFIDRDTNVGYRYSYFRDSEILELLSLGKVERITLVLWEEKDAIPGSDYEDERVKIILLWDLFHEFFYDLPAEEIEGMYELFTAKITNAVDRANSMISLTTVPGFTPSYLYKTRQKAVETMRKDVRLLTCFSVNDANYKQTEVNSKALINTYGLAQFFLGKRYEYAFVGTSDFAKCYLTSEYLYRYFKDNPMFDYTPIVSGYLKSIEQLLHTIYTRYLKQNNIQKDLSSYTLGKYITDFQRERIFRKELVPAKGFIISCLHSYRAESRNNLFHKDYFNSWDKVEQIRENTIFLYVVILSAVDQTLLANDPAVLAILNTEYDHLFCAIEDQNSDYYSFILEGIEYNDLRKEPRRQGLVFTENGLITNPIVFKRLQYDQFETIEITRDKIPSEIWTTDSTGNKKSRIWPMP